MDIEIAFIKYFRQLIGIAQLSYVAAEWLRQGNYSLSMTLLAYSFNPFDYSQSEVEKWVDTSIKDLGLTIPKIIEDSEFTRHGPLSATGSDFRDFAIQTLSENGQLIALRRHAYMGGGGFSWHLISSSTEWDKLISEGKRRTAYTIFLEQELTLKGECNQYLAADALALFDKWGDIIVAEIHPSDSSISIKEFNWVMTGYTHEDAEESRVETQQLVTKFLKDKTGCTLAIGRSFWLWEHEIRELTAYIPESDGSIKTGAY